MGGGGGLNKLPVRRPFGPWSVVVRKQGLAAQARARRGWLCSGRTCASGLAGVGKRL